MRYPARQRERERSSASFGMIRTSETLTCQRSSRIGYESQTGIAPLLHELLDKPSREYPGADHARAREDRRPARHAAPHVDAGIARLAFARIKLFSKDGIDAVAGDRDTAWRSVPLTAARPV
jgi:hypothetical protein